MTVYLEVFDNYAILCPQGKCNWQLLKSFYLIIIIIDVIIIVWCECCILFTYLSMTQFLY